MNFSDRLKEAISVRGYTQERLASEAKITQSYISRMINGQKEPSERLLDSLSAILKVNVEWLKTGEGPMEAEPTLEEALARLSADVLADEPDSFRARLVEVLADLSADECRLLEGIASKLAKRRPSLTLGLRFAGKNPE